MIRALDEYHGARAPIRVLTELESIEDFDTLEQPHGDQTGAVTEVGLELAALRSLAPGTEDCAHQLLVHATSMALFGEPQVQVPSIGKYELVKHLGAGGMGEVYLCKDPDLGRKVAIKRIIDRDNPMMRERLRREAQALARLNHRNVVQVYESGEHDGQLHIVMEYVPGQTLQDWLGDAPRSWREVLARFAEAGRGLAAAHDAGLVHRDFKPANVLIGHDGIVRVADFGLAAGNDWLPVDDQLHSDEGHAPESRLSAAGSLLGTCAYMPLEQLLGRQVDARSDQFAFCVSLYEALWGAFPFDGHTLRARAEALRHNRPVQPRGLAAIYRVIRRGLERDPARRWPSMSALLDALARIRRRRRRFALALPLVFGFGLAATLAASLGARYGGGGENDPCVDPQAQLSGTWDTSQRRALERELADKGLTQADRQRLLAPLDAQAKRWADAWTSACHAQQPGWEPCLERERSSLERIREGLAQAEPEELAGFALSVEDFTDPVDCVDGSAARELEPLDPSQRHAVEKLRDRLAAVRTTRMLGKLEIAHETAAELVEDARAVGHGPTLARALAELAKTQDVTNDEGCVETYEQAIQEATLAGLSGLLAELYLELAEWTVIEDPDQRVAGERYKNARNYTPDDAPEPRRAKLAFVEATLAKREDRREDARRAYMQALELSDSNQRAYPAYLLGLAEVIDDPSREAELLAEAVEVSERLFGSQHRSTAEALGRYCRTKPDEPRCVEWAQREYDGCERTRAARARAEQAYELEQLKRMEEEAREVLANTKTCPDAHNDYAVAAQLLMAAAMHAGDLTAAIAHVRTALEHYEYDPISSREHAQVRLNLATLLLRNAREEDFAEISELCALVIANAGDEPDLHGDALEILAELGQAAGDPEVDTER